MTSRSGLVLDEPTARVCEQIATGGLGVVRLAVVAPAGYGKTALLAHLMDRCAEAGTKAVPYGAVDVPDGPVLLLVDDAHQLPDSAFDELTKLGADPRVGMVVTARPAPRPAGFGKLTAALRGQLVLRPLDRASVREVLGGKASDELVAFVAEQTGGVPGLVGHTAAALDLTAPPPAQLPDTALAAASHELDTADPDTVAYLLAAQAGVARDIGLLRAVLDRDPEEVVDLARATGLLAADGTLLPIGARALDSLISQQRRTALHSSLAEAQLGRGGPVLDLVSPLIASGVRGQALAEAIEAGAREAAGHDPALAVLLFDAAVKAGRPVEAVVADWAVAAMRSGAVDAALRLADKAMASADQAARDTGIEVAAAALAQRGQLAAATALLRRSPSGIATAFAAIGLLGTGRVDEARAALAKAPTDSLLSDALGSTARGLLESVTGEPTVALSTVVSAAELAAAVAPSVVLPDHPAAIGVLMAVHCGEPAVASALLDRATPTPRLTLLGNWLTMLHGEATVPDLAGLEARDLLFALAIELGVARRASDLAAMRRIWGQAGEVIIRHPVDLFTLLPLGEFAVAAARLDDRERVRPHLDQAWRLLADLGDPPFWSGALRWNALHAAIVAGERDEAAVHADALGDMAEAGPHHAALSSGADVWLAVLGGRVDAEEVETAARGLHATGLHWDAARLAGQAAIRTTDRKDMVRLLECARGLQGGGPEPAEEQAQGQSQGGVRLSEREVQVAELVVAGMTYKQVGDQLFISAKTVEHHMARMRQRIGATSRSDLLSQLRELIAK
ncbi:helix-turn-helix transcriptional regulator [Labedaea rhizosphaerae]|uniref:DNA-binding CsgD family transcriptional regulator n=1 Tax=Labedaea rhizosphaerae TaxID=598644 RepID=A0A4R6SHJ2_LABRH|nr:helix-turn-helix transcriptional regulator [Labedaea rhizosphaerae]TDQ01020.1 DNA-binding CsgD family transcriptional regulator [Labedaea rhizosphaerae]